MKKKMRKNRCSSWFVIFTLEEQLELNFILGVAM